MSDKRPSSTKVRRECFDYWKRLDEAGTPYLVCYMTGARIYPSRGDQWEAEHSVRRSSGGSDKPPNVKPVLVSAHKPKTSSDITENAKGKRVAEKHFGIKRKGWGGKYRKKMNGEVVERDR